MKNDEAHGQKTTPGYEFAGRWKINISASAQVSMAAGAVLFFVIGFISGTLIRGLLRASWELQFTVSGLGFIPVTVGAIIAVMILHEALHGLAFLFFGARPRFGVKLIGKFFPVGYSTSSSRIRRNRYLLVCLAPFFLITIAFLGAGIIANAGNIIILSLAMMAMNLGGSIGDLIMAWKISRHDRKTLFEDTEDGFIWYVPANCSHTTFGEL